MVRGICWGGLGKESSLPQQLRSRAIGSTIVRKVRGGMGRILEPPKHCCKGNPAPDRSNPRGRRSGRIVTLALGPESVPDIVPMTSSDPSVQNVIVFGSIAAAVLFSFAAASKGEPELCEGCEGTGGARCFGCNGTGRLETAKDTDIGSEGRRDAAGRSGNRYQCSVCGGSGLLACKRCNGSGMSRSL
mmetsp:Transcript_22119/g.61401  ORF Transcript_22119/g.61401 Transcript_22119/m.61401 type:complete len:188 (+) Transcript_22119:250-813(+)